jgi:hypothetical protein
MSNIVAMAVCRIKEDKGLEYNKDIGASQTYDMYHAMHEMVMHSASEFLEGDFEFEIFEYEVDNYQEVFHKNFQLVYDLWKEGHNVLFLDTDTMIIRPVEVFGKFKHFQMFNYTDPKKLGGKDAENKYGLQHDDYFNAGVRYYPQEMSQEVWDLGWKYANDWDYNIWGTEQIIFNEMMYSQDRDPKRWHKPDYGFQCMGMRFDASEEPKLLHLLNTWNECNYQQDAKILHLHGTRGAKNTVLLQYELLRRWADVEVEPTRVEIVKDENGWPVDVKSKE